LKRYHLYGVGLAVLVMSVFFGGLYFAYLIAESFYSYTEDFVILTGFVFGILLIVLIIFKLGPPVRRRIKAEMDPLQREVAVRLARERLRRDLRRRSHR